MASYRIQNSRSRIAPHVHVDFLQATGLPNQLSKHNIYPSLLSNIHLPSHVFKRCIYFTNSNRIISSKKNCLIYNFAGSWSLQFERGSGLVSLRSLLWQGYTFYHIPGTNKYGSIYLGTGEKNMDLPFML